MGYSKRTGTEITDYWPDDTDNTIYRISGSETLEELMNIAKKKWPNASISDIEISAEKIHTECLSYERQDPSDYTEFIILTYAKIDNK